MATIYHGTDVYTGQGTIDWATYAANKNFVIIKAGGADDGLYTDGSFATNQAGARAQAGLRIGYYFFGYSTLDATASANYFISILGNLNNGEILCLDIEGLNHPDDNWAFDFCTAVHNTLKFYPFVYMSQHSPTNTSLEWQTTNPIAPMWMANYGLADTDFSQVTGNVDSTWGGLAAPNYRILQYSSTGVVPGVPGNRFGFTDLDSFYSPNNSLTDWDNLGFQGATPPVPPNPGTLTIGTVTNPTMTYTQPSTETIAVPENSYDQVLFSTKYKAPTLTSSSWPVNIAGPSTGINQYAYPFGNFTYSIQGTSNLNDYGFINAADFGQYPGALPAVVVQPIVDSTGGLSFDVTVNGISGSVSVDLTLNIALLAYPNASDVPISTVTQNIARSNVFAGGTPTAYSTYRRIASDSSVGQGTTTIAHALSTIPNLVYWVQDNSGTIEMQPVSWSDTGHNSSFGLSMDSTNVYFFVDSSNNSLCWYRIYKDN